MKNIPLEVNDKAFLPKCWLWENRMYTYIGDANEKLPTVRETDEEVLKSLGISYRRTVGESGDFVLEYWNKEVFSEREVELPLYVKMGKNYKYSGKYYTGKVPTKRSVDVANHLADEVEELIEELEQQKEDERIFKVLRRSLNGRQAKAYYDPNNELGDVTEKDMLYGEDHLKLIRVAAPSMSGKVNFTNWYAVLDVNSIELNSIVEMEVPERVAGLFIGTKGWQIKFWCQKLGVKYIKVVAV